MVLLAQPAPKSLRGVPSGTISLRVEGIDEDSSGWYLRVRNTSSRDLAGYSVTVGNNSETSYQYEWGAEPMLRAGQPGRFPIQNAALNPGPGQAVIGAVVFTDTTYEGDPEAAAVLLVPRMAIHVAQERLLAALTRLVADDQPPSLEEVRLRIAAVQTRMDVVSVLEISGRFPSLGSPLSPALGAQFEQVAKLQKNRLLQKIEEAGKQGAFDLKATLARLADELNRGLR
jgi:hypothetical protein